MRAIICRTSSANGANPTGQSLRQQIEVHILRDDGVGFRESFERPKTTR